MSKVIDEDGNDLTWTAVYWSYYQKYEEVCDSLDEAIEFLKIGEDNGSLSSVEILGPDGEAVVPESEIFDAVYGYGRWASGQREATILEIAGGSK